MYMKKEKKREHIKKLNELSQKLRIIEVDLVDCQITIMFNFFFKQTEPLYIYGKGTGPWGQLEKEWLSFTKEKLRFPLKKYLKRAVYSIFYGAEPEKVASLIKEEASSEEEAKTLLSFFLQSKLNQVLYEIKKNMQLAVLGGCLFPLNPDILEKFKDPK